MNSSNSSDEQDQTTERNKKNKTDSVPSETSSMQKSSKDNETNEGNEDNELESLNPVYVRKHISKNNVNPTKVNSLIRYLRRNETITSYSEVARKVHMDSKTIKKWHEKSKNTEWHPLVAGKPTHQALSDMLEGGIIWYIYNNYLKQGFQFTDTMCRHIALAFARKYSDMVLSKRFTASSSWIRRFKKKYGLVNRRVHYHRRNIQTKESIERANAFRAEMQACYKRHKENNTLHLLINVDETAWRIGAYGDLTWASKGVDHVEFSSTFNEKESVTAIAAITASPDFPKLPLSLIKAGKTEISKRVLSALSPFLQIDISDNGWSTAYTFASYLIWLRREVNERYKEIPGYIENAEIDLILDLHASHRHEYIKELAAALNFALHYIPASMTDYLQPLDRNVFGALKAMARAEWYKMFILKPDHQFNIADACAILLRCWSTLSNKTQQKAWAPYSLSEDNDINCLLPSKNLEAIIKPSKLTISKEDIKREINEFIDIIKFGSETEEKSSCGIDFDLFDPIGGIQPNIIHSLNAIIANEESLKDLFDSKWFFKPISNLKNTCYANSTIQLISAIPGIREVLRNITGNETMEVIKEALNDYDDSANIVNGFKKRFYDILKEDVFDNLNLILGLLGNKYGMYLPEFLTSRYIINIPAKSSIEEAIQKNVNENIYEFHNIMFFEKYFRSSYIFPELFRYENYLFILKAAVKHKENEHYYIYMRDNFTHEIILINDAQIKEAEIEDINDDTITLAMYCVFDTSDEGEIPGKSEDEIQEMNLPSNIEEILNKIVQNHTKKNISVITRSKPSTKNALGITDEAIPRQRMQLSFKDTNT